MSGEPAEPCTRSLFQPVERLVEAANKVGVRRILKPRRLRAIDSLGQSAMKKCILHIKLVHGPLTGES